MTLVTMSLALALAACGGDADGTGETTAATEGVVTTQVSEVADPGIDVCTLVENVDLDALVGEPVGAAESDGTVCAALPESIESSGLIAIGFDPDGAAAYAESEDVLGADSAVDGLGDEAFLTSTWLHVRAGDLYVDLQVMRDSEATPVTEDELVEAMRIILTNVGLDF